MHMLAHMSLHRPGMSVHIPAHMAAHMSVHMHAATAMHMPAHMSMPWFIDITGALLGQPRREPSNDAHTRARTCTQTRNYANTRTHACTHARGRTCVHTQPPQQQQQQTFGVFVCCLLLLEVVSASSARAATGRCTCRHRYRPLVLSPPFFYKNQRILGTENRYLNNQQSIGIKKICTAMSGPRRW